MIDLVGAFLSIVFLFVIAAVASGILALLIWLLLLRRGTRKKRYIVAAILFPLATAGWFAICTILLPGVSIFGDIDQPLPHHFKLTALGKMSDAGVIEDGDLPPATVHLPPCSISKAAVDGLFLAGQCTYKYFGQETREFSSPYFAFNTATGNTTGYPNEAALDSALGHHVKLSELPYFHSPVGAFRDHLVRTIELLPPALGLLLLILSIIAEHRRVSRCAFS